MRGYDDRDAYRARDPVPMYRDEYDRRGAPPPRERYDPLPPPRDAGFRDDVGDRYRPRSPIGGAPRRRSFR